MSTLIKYIKETKYDSHIFEVIQTGEDECVLKTKTFKNKKYVYLSKKKVKCKDILEKDNIYSLNVKQWVHIPYVRTLFYLSAVPEKCTINFSSDSE